MPDVMITYTGVGFCVLPSDLDRAMREASVRRTVTDTESYAFFIIKRQREDDRGKEFLLPMIEAKLAYNKLLEAIESIENHLTYLL